MTAGVPDSAVCYLVRKTGKNQIDAGIERRPLHELPAGDLLVRVVYSSLNYKDAMAATGHPGIVKSFPHVPGIDAAGTVIASESEDFRAGDPVIVTGYELGAERWGGWAEYVRVPSEWAVPLPSGLSLKEAMIYGTAGFTAAQSVRALLQNDITPQAGEVLVSGASGGVGSIAVAVLAKLGYEVAAVTGKPEKADWLKQQGAARIVERQSVIDKSSRPLLPARWAAAVDTVGGTLLTTTVRSTKHRGCVTCCGLVGGSELPLTVYPFILRGVRLIGIDSARCPRESRREIWRLLAGDWKPDQLNGLAEEIDIRQVGKSVEQMLSGRHSGRAVIVLNPADASDRSRSQANALGPGSRG